MRRFKIVGSALLGLAMMGGCIQHHEARVQTALLPPPGESPVQHTGRLWVELGDATWQTQCRAPKGQRQLCFGGVRRAAFGALERSLWTSFPEVTLREGEALAAGDYLLQLDVTLDALPPDADGPGWSAVATGGFRLSRDGKLLLEQRLGSRSRAAFAYGSALGVGAGEVVDAFAAHVAGVLGALAEERPLRPAPLPVVIAEVLIPVPGTAPATLDGPAPALEPATSETVPAPLPPAELPSAPASTAPDGTADQAAVTDDTPPLATR